MMPRVQLMCTEYLEGCNLRRMKALTGPGTAGEAETSEGAASVRLDQPEGTEGEDRDECHNAREASSEGHSEKCVYAAASSAPQEEEKDRQRAVRASKKGGG
jgi:hypothetical protein